MPDDADKLAALEGELTRLAAEEPSIEARALANRLDRLQKRIDDARASLPDKDEDPRKVWTRIVVGIWVAFFVFGTLIFLLTKL